MVLFIDDHSRVVLKAFTAGEGDYINANYIEVRIDKGHEYRIIMLTLKAIIITYVIFELSSMHCLF